MCNTCIHYKTDKCKICYDGKILSREDYSALPDVIRSPEASYNDLIVAGITALKKEEYK
jgi:hypothetical protein